jgi:hypothetical protein
MPLQDQIDTWSGGTEDSASNDLVAEVILRDDAALH